MPTLYLSVRSPFARKVRILLLEKQIAFDVQTIEIAKRTPEFFALSPLGKVPVFVDDDGTRVFDSTVIAEYLEDRFPKPAVFGEGVQERLRHRTLDELGDTLAEHAVALFYADDPNDAAYLDKHNQALDKALREIDQIIEAGRVPKSFGVGQAAVIAALGYLHFRLGNARTQGFPRVVQWAESFAQRPSVLGAPSPVE